MESDSCKEVVKKEEKTEDLKLNLWMQLFGNCFIHYYIVPFTVNNYMQNFHCTSLNYFQF